MKKFLRQNNYMQTILEMIIVFAGVLAFGFMTSGEVLFSSLNPNPLWIPVILAAVQYGTIVAVLCTCVATVFLLIAGQPEPNHVEDYYEHFLNIWRDPALWLVASVAIGQIRDREFRHNDKVSQRLDQLELERQEIATYCVKLNERYSALERRITTGDSFIPALLMLRSSNRESFDAAFRTFAFQVLGPCSYSVCLRRNGIAEWLTAGDEPVHELASYQEALDAVAREPRVLSMLDGASRHPLKNALFAVPILDRLNNRVKGLIFITAMEPNALKGVDETALELLSAELSDALARGVGLGTTRLSVDAA